MRSLALSTLAVLMLLLLPAISRAEAFLTNAGTDGVGLQGYDPVAFFTLSKAKLGSPVHTAEHEGVTYRFVSGAHKRAFTKDPAKYAPQYGGFCAISMSRGKLEPVEIDTWSVEGDRLYLQRDAKAAKMWRDQGAAGFIEQANENWLRAVERFASPITADQVTRTHHLTLAAAEQIASAARDYAEREDAPGGAIAVVDGGGHLLVLVRLDGTFPAASEVAEGKARTAAQFRMPSKNLEDGILAGRTSLVTVGHNMLRGGVPIFFRGEIVGGIGVSGAASADQDVEIAEAGLDLEVSP